MSRKWSYTIWFFVLATSPIGCFEINESDNDVDDYDMKIAGGSQQSTSKLPWMAQLRSNTSTYLCGGTIVSSTWILTAAGCVSAIAQAAGNSTSFPLTVRVGSDQLDSGGQLLNVTQIVLHASYNATSSDFDFALVKVTNMTMGSMVKAATLPTQGQRLPLVAFFDVPGWGVTSDSSPAFSTNLKSVLVPIIPLSKCRMKYGSSVSIGNNVFCTNVFLFGGKGPCRGDNGGPAVYKDVVVGVTVGSLTTCGNPKFPALFGTVATVIAWIKGTAGI